MGIAELIRLMQELYQQAEAQLAHVDPLSRSRQSWAAVQTGLADTEALLRQKAGEIGPGWPDEAGQLYAERLDRSSTTVQSWQQTLAAADIPTLVTDLATLVRTTVDAVRAQWDRFVALVEQLGAVAASPTALAAVDAITTQLAAIVQETANLLRTLDARFTEAATRITGAADGTPWDGPAIAGATADADAATTKAAGPAPTPTPADGAAAVSPLAAAGIGPVNAGLDPTGAGAPSGIAPVGIGEPSLAGGPSPVAAGISPVTPPVGPATFVPPLGASLIPPVAAGLGGGRPSPVGGRPSPVGLGGSGARIPTVAGAAAAGMIPQAGRTIAGAPPLAGGQMPPVAAGSPPTAAAGATTGPTRLFPGLLGAGLHGARNRNNGDPRPGDQESPHRSRPLKSIPGVPPALRGRTGALDETPDFLTGPRQDQESTEPPLNEDLWQATRPPNPFTSRRR